MLAHFQWKRDPRNPVLPPLPELEHESTRCMNPFVVRNGDEYRLYYSGGDHEKHQRLCLATTPVKEPFQFKRHGVILDLGPKGNFDGHWCVLPCVHKFRNRWHLYYTGHEGSNMGLQSFPGIGLAVSEDGIHFKRLSNDPVVTGNMTREFARNRGVAGGGTILEDQQPDGSIRYRMYYTVAVGTKNKDMRIDQEKHCAVCHSADGITWTDHRIVMSPRRDEAKEDAAVAAPFVWRDGALYRMLYSSIGTRWGFYSLSEAFSPDGYKWHRGMGDENLSLQPGAPGSWEDQMVEYPGLIQEGNRLRLFYCGNGYGTTGIGTAVADLKN